MLRWRDTPLGNSVLLPVHDEIIAMVPETVGLAATAARRLYANRVPGHADRVEADEPSYAWADAA